jgi:hypothetical protein
MCAFVHVSLCLRHRENFHNLLKYQTKWQSHDSLIDNLTRKRKKHKNANQQKFLAENSSLCPSIPSGASAIPATNGRQMHAWFFIHHIIQLVDQCLWAPTHMSVDLCLWAHTRVPWCRKP